MKRQPSMDRRRLLAGGSVAALSGATLAFRALAQSGSDNVLDDRQTPAASTEPPAPTESPVTPEPAADPTEPPAPTEAPDASRIRLGEGLLPDNRVLLYYGFPENPNMGILGEHDPAQLLDLLKEQAAAYEVADDSRPWKLGFELIASVAQASPQSDNSYVADTDGDWLDLYTEFTAENDLVLFLDVQMGRKEPKEDYAGLERWLKYDHVHLGIDPEFKMWGDEVPGQDLGHIEAHHVTEAQKWLIDLANRYGLSRKTLIVHQFHHWMIHDKDQIKQMIGVDLVIDEDGWGPPDLKRETYNAVITNEPIEYHGIKLFYDQDEPLMSPEDVMALEPVPDLVIYQ